MDIYTIVTSIFVLLTGLCFGSFLNVVVLRAFSGESISYPASKCPKCQKPLYWWHNIPLLSYLLLGGKCYFCKTHISWQYPIVEAVTGLLFLLSFWKLGMSAYLIYVWAVIFMSLALVITDIKEQVIFTLHAIVLCLIGLIYHAGATGIMALNGQELTWLHNPLTTSILGMLLGGLITLIYFVIAYILAGGRMGMGDGDIYIAMALGACFGWEKIWLIILIAFLLQAAYLTVVFEYKLLQEKNYKLFASILLLIPLIAGYYYSNVSGIFWENNIFLLIYTIVLYGFGIYVAFQLIRKVLGSKTEGFAAPFGPALVLAGLLTIFFPIAIVL